MKTRRLLGFWRCDAHRAALMGILLGQFPAAAIPARADGVTLITHGANPSAASSPTWMASMRDAIATNYLAGARNYGTITVTGSAGSLVATCNPWNVDLSTGSNGDIVIVLDWAAVASATTTGVSAQDVAAVVVDKFLTGQNGSRPLAELPIHLIGHSRGGSVVCELARLLGEHGLVVDHLTPLDPHPLTTNDTQPAIPIIDTPMAVYENVVFADVYFQTNSYPAGQYVSGCYNRPWPGAMIGGYHNNSWPYNIYADHRNMFLLYQATITLTNPVNNSEATAGATERAAWFNTNETAGANTGFIHSRLGGGNRASTNCPVANADTIRAGLNNAVVFGGSGARSNLTWSSAVWPNVASLDVLMNGATVANGTVSVPVGSTPQLRYVYLDYNSGCTIKLHVDADLNPYNHNDVAMISTQLVASATRRIYVQNTASWNTSGLAPGSTAFVYAEITDGVRTRYFYAAPAFRLTPAKPAAFSGTRLSANKFILTGTNGTPNTPFALLTTTNLGLPLGFWSPAATNLFGENGSFIVTDTISAHSLRKFYRLAY